MGFLRYWLVPILGLIAVAQSPDASKKPRFWAFRSPVKSDPPANGAANPIDAFLLAKLQAKGLTFSNPADPVTQLRRLAFDLTGLPPGPGDLREPYEKAVDRLLASPHYGERWGRYWLDVVRFGETDGGEHNYERLAAWPYRDYVIESLNQDKPYHQFVREQLTGDLLSPHDPKMVAATGFLTAGPWDSVSAELNKDKTLKAQARMDELDDMVTTTFHTFQALTVNCARCHDHKFDPIPTRDYYRLTSVFGGVGFGTRAVAAPGDSAAYEAKTKPLRESLRSLDRQIGAIEDPVRTRILLARYHAFDRELAAGPRRLPINPVWNRNTFAPVAASRFRLVISSHQKDAPQIDRLELLPAGPVLTAWKGPRRATDDDPVIVELDHPSRTPVTALEWSSDRVNGSRDGAVLVYRLESSTGGDTWTPVCASLDHVGRNELDMPEVSPAELNAALTPEQRTAVAALRAARQGVADELKRIPELPRVYAAQPHEISPSFLLERGMVARPKEEVVPGALTAISQVNSDFALNGESSDAARRRALAGWITSPQNPLTARVIVNRVWFYHFGKGIVNTPSDFGLMGDRPSHPELLDWLAVSFMENGWSLKWLHRLIVTSQAYRQSSVLNDQAFAVDADNRLLWHMPLKRMDAETMRDSILAAAGNLNLAAGGPGFFLQKKGDRGSYIYKALDNDGPEVWRRAVYRFVVRGGERIMLDSFDCPDPAVATPQRSVSNTPVQALTLLNNDFVLKQAGAFAQRLEREAGPDPDAQIRRAYLLLFGRTPAPNELTSGRRFIAQQSLALYCRALFNTNEFLYVP